VFRSRDPGEIAQGVGSRTVYSAEEIALLTENGKVEVMAILMSQSRVLSPAWDVASLEEHGVFARPPQSIMKITGDGERWARKQLSA